MSDDPIGDQMVDDDVREAEDRRSEAISNLQGILMDALYSNDPERIKDAEESLRDFYAEECLSEMRFAL